MTSYLTGYIVKLFNQFYWVQQEILLLELYGFCLDFNVWVLNISGYSLFLLFAFADCFPLFVITNKSNKTCWLNYYMAQLTFKKMLSLFHRLYIAWVTFNSLYHLSKENSYLEYNNE